MSPFPWAQAMGFGFGILKLDPAQFWALTPRELASAIKAVTARSRPVLPPSRETLATLMAAFPDTGDTNGQ